MQPKNYQAGMGTSVSKLFPDMDSPKDKPIIIGPPIRGLNMRRKPSEIEDNETPYCLNARVRRDYIEPRWGYSLVSSAFDAPIMYIREFVLSTGGLYLVVITTKSLYTSINLTTFTRVPWYYTAGTAATDGTVNVVGTSTAWLTNVRVGDGFRLDAIGPWGTVATVVDDTHLTLVNTYDTAATQAYHIDRYFGGTFEDTFWAVTIPDVDWFVFSQGVDRCLYIDSLVSGIDYVNANCPASLYGAVYGDRLVLGYTIESSINYPYRTRWSAAGNYDDWTGTGSGFNDLVDDPYDIAGLSVASNICVIYKTYSITHMSRTGNTAEPFAFKLTVPGIGSYVPGTLVSIDDADIFAGSDNFYSYDTRAIKGIGDDIKDHFIDSLNPTYSGIGHALVIEEVDEIQFFYPGTDSTTPDRVLVWNYDMSCWGSEWTVTATASGYATQETTESWDADSGAWDDDTTAWDDTTILANRPLNMIANGTSLYKWNPSALTDAGVNFIFEWQTKDVAMGSYQEVSTYRVIAEYYAQTSVNLKCSLSINGGKTWEAEATIALDYANPSQKRRAKFDFLTTGETIRVRLRCTDGGRFQIVRLLIEAVASGEIIS
jgi:hypothetical protein